MAADTVIVKSETNTCQGFFVLVLQTLLMALSKAIISEAESMSELHDTVGSIPGSFVVSTSSFLAVPACLQLVLDGFDQLLSFCALSTH